MPVLYYVFRIVLIFPIVPSLCCHAADTGLESRVARSKEYFENELSNKLNSQARLEMARVGLEYIRTAKLRDYDKSSLLFVDFQKMTNPSYPALLMFCVIGDKQDYQSLLIYHGEKLLETIPIDQEERKLTEKSDERQLIVFARVIARKWAYKQMPGFATEIPSYWLSSDPITARFRRLDGSLSNERLIYRTDAGWEAKKRKDDLREERKRQGLSALTLLDERLEKSAAKVQKEYEELTKPSTRTLSNASSPAEWLPLFGALGMARETGTAEQQREAFEKFMALNPDKMPPEWRLKFYEERFQQYRRQSDWKELLRMRYELVQKTRANKTENLTDADVLVMIASCFCTESFFPPKTLRGQDNTAAYERFSKEYKEKNYRDEGTARALWEYVTKHFDENYATVVFAHLALARSQSKAGYGEDALKTYRKLESLLAAAKMYALPRFIDKAGGTVLSTEEVLKEKKETYKAAVANIPASMINAMAHMRDKSEAVKDLRGQSKKYRDNEPMRKEIEACLRDLSTQTPEDIPAEEMGLPVVK